MWDSPAFAGPVKKSRHIPLFPVAETMHPFFANGCARCRDLAFGSRWGGEGGPDDASGGFLGTCALRSTEEISRAHTEEPTVETSRLRVIT